MGEKPAKNSRFWSIVLILWLAVVLFLFLFDMVFWKPSNPAVPEPVPMVEGK